MYAIKSHRFFINLFLLLSLLPFLYGCQFNFVDNIEETPSNTTTSQFEQAVPYAETFFNLTIPGEVSEEIIIEIVDDSTGIELNPSRYAMDQLTINEYQIVLPLKLGSIIKYRYFRNGTLPIYESNQYGEKVQYRVAYVSSAIELSDIVSNWEDQLFSYQFGRIEGVVTSQNNSPLPNLLVNAGGNSTFTNSLGQFTLSGLPAGKHNLVVLSTDGEYGVFQQEAVVGEGLTTPANIKLSPSSFVNITFIITPPNNEGQNSLPIRILGNTYQLGNVFAKVYNGVNNLASRSPKLSPLPDGRYTITLSLPSGYDLRYKYSLGDGFWNAEQSSEGTFKVRQIIVPNEDMVIEDVIYSWGSGNNSPVTFNVQVPDNTDAKDIVSIQFNPFGWTAPIPMTKIGSNQWTFTLYGPFNILNNISYRYCRNDACGFADDQNTLGNLTKGFTFTSSPLPQTFSDEIANWFGWNPTGLPTTLVAPSINNRGADFVTGAYFSTRYNPLEAVFIDQAYQNLVDINSNTVIIPIEWTLSSFSPVQIEPVAGENPLWKDLLLMIQKAQLKGLNVWLIPNVEINNLAMSQWNQNSISDTWETQFVSEYQDFLLYTADMAAYMGVEGVILPTRVVHVQSNMNYEQMGTIIETALLDSLDELSIHYSGNYYLELNNFDFKNETILSQVDGFMFNAELSSPMSLNSIEEIQNSFINLFDNEIYPNYGLTDKPIWVGLNYPSAVGAETGCIQFGDDCVDFQILNYLNSDTQSTMSIDLQKQADIYQGALAALNQTSWIKGVITYGYNPQVSLQDATSSIRGKPASDVLWYWNPRLLGLIQ